MTDYGFRAVISARFADIFRGNSLKGGLLPVQLPAPVVAQLQDLVESDPAALVTVDLEARQVRAHGVLAPFELDDFTRWRLMEGLDDIDLTLRHAEEVEDFERRRPTWKPSALRA